MAYISVTNTMVNGNTADATHVNTNFSDLVNGTSDGTKDLYMATARIGGAEKLKHYTYTADISAADILVLSHDFTITAVTRANVRMVCSVGYDVSTGEVSANTDKSNSTLYTWPFLTSTTNLRVRFGTQYVANDKLSITIIEAQ